MRQLLYSSALQHKLESRWAIVIGAFPIGFHRDHIFLLLHFRDSHVSVCTDELLFAPTRMASWPAKRRPESMTMPSLGKKARKAFVSSWLTALTNRLTRVGSAGLLIGQNS